MRAKMRRFRPSTSVEETRSWIKGACAIGEAEDLRPVDLQGDQVSLGARRQHSDADAVKAVVSSLGAPEVPDLLLLHLGDVQNTGFVRGLGPHVDTCMDTIESTDKKLGEVIGALRDRQLQVHTRRLARHDYLSLWRYVPSRHAGWHARSIRRL